MVLAGITRDEIQDSRGASATPQYEQHTEEEDENWWVHRGRVLLTPPETLDVSPCEKAVAMIRRSWLMHVDYLIRVPINAMPGPLWP